jgi:hypothetical protein
VKAKARLLAAAGIIALAATPASASESGTSFYLLGSGGPGAGMLPPVRGIFFDSTFYFYDGSAGGDRRFPLAGNIVADLDASLAADFLTVMWVPSTDMIGGTLALTATVPVGRPDIEAGAVISGPLGNQVQVSREDAATVIADPVLGASLGWQVAGMHLAASTQINVPIGHYREGALANLAFNRWVADFSLAASWHQVSEESGWDVSGKAGITFNGTNAATDYQTGTEFHAEAAVEYVVSPQFSIGAQAYHFQQISGDSGAGARLGPFKGRITGVGGTAAYRFQIGRVPVTARARLFTEFGAENRLEGTAAMFSLTLPLAVRMPAAPAG